MKWTLLLFFIIISFAANAQTNVSGGIYANTTWTKTNSPYIVTDTIVLFPGVTLTIEPGVVVKFDDHMFIEVRNGSLVANGNSVDSITFTSNSVTPIPGMWGDNNHGGIYLNGAQVTSFSFCIVEYATKGIYNGNVSSIKNSIFVNNVIGLSRISGTSVDSCVFKFNSNGIENPNSCSFNFCNISNNTNGIGDMVGGNLFNCTIDSNQTGLGGELSEVNIQNCIINYNGTGLSDDNGGGNTLKNCVVDFNSVEGIGLYGDGLADSVVNCEIKFNGVGLLADTYPGIGGPSQFTQNVIENNVTGIYLDAFSEIYCNRICNNTSYDLQNFSNLPFSVPNNYWCTTDSTTIAAHIYDGYDNISLGLITFIPVDSVCAPGALTSVNEIANENSFHIYPNPLTTSSTLQFNTQLKDAEVIIYDMLGHEVMRKRFSGDKMEIERGNLESGVYFVKVNTEERQYVQKIIVE